MTATVYKIKDVADRSGFSTATLRYYEEIGLLPEPERTAAGYRLYDDTTLERLAFIARAKQLGCTLDEIADLATAWNGGRCGPVQDRLRSVVAAKLDDTRHHINELTTLVADLEQATVALERHRPDGPCDDTCGCISEPGQSPSVQHTVAITKPSAAVDGVETPIACTLTVGSLRGRVEDWRALLEHAADREPIAGGIRVVFAATVPVEDLMQLTAAEHDCCQFLAFAITVDTRGIALEITSATDAIEIVQSLFGTAA